MDSQDHHYVPRFLLAPWCTPDNPRATAPLRLWACRRLPTGKLHHTRWTPKATGYVRDLYRQQPSLVGTPPGIWEAPDAIEQAYGRLESEAAVIRDKLIDGTPPSELSPEQRQRWAEFVATLEHRNPRDIRRAEASGRDVLEDLKARFRQQVGDESRAAELLTTLDLEAVVKNAARSTPLAQRAKLAEPLKSWAWAVTTRDDVDLITADYPVASLMHEDGCVATYLPLSPRALFIAMCAPIDESAKKVAVHISNLLLIQQKPNFIYSLRRLADGPFARLLTAAGDLLEEPEELEEL